MPFIYKKSRNPNGGRELIEITITDATTLTIGDSVKTTSGLLVLSGTGGATVGILAGIRKADGSPVTDNGAGGDYVDTYLTPSSNTVVGIVDVSLESVYSVTADATLGSTTGSDLFGYTMDVVSASDQLDETSSLTTTGQFFSYGPDPDGSAATNSVLVSIMESYLRL